MLVFSMKRWLCQVWGGCLGIAEKDDFVHFLDNPIKFFPKFNSFQDLYKWVILSLDLYKWVILSLDLIDKIIVLCSYIDLWWKLTNWTFKTTWSNLSVVFKAFARKPDVFLYILQNRKSHVHKNSGHSELVELIPCCSKTALMQTAALHDGRCPLNSGH